MHVHVLDVYWTLVVWVPFTMVVRLYVNSVIRMLIYACRSARPNNRRKVTIVKNEAWTIRCDGLSIAQAGKNRSQEKRYQSRVIGLNVAGGDYEN